LANTTGTQDYAPEFKLEVANYAARTDTIQAAKTYSVNRSTVRLWVLETGVKKQARKLERTLIWPDTHHPFHDGRLVALVLKFQKWYRPDRVIYLGDHVDFGPVSRYTQDPRGEVDIQTQLDATGSFLEQSREATPGAERIYVEGNHEVRLSKYILRNAGQLAYLKRDGEDVLSVPFLLRLKERGVRWVPEWKKYQLHGFVVEHGDCASQASSATAKRMVDKRRASTISGHTHRLGAYFHNGHGDPVQGYEVGCLIDKKSEAAAYAGGVPNWQHGFAVVEHDPETSSTQVTLVPIVDGRFLFQGAVWS
jgi:hypothetical protein